MIGPFFNLKNLGKWAFDEAVNLSHSLVLFISSPLGFTHLIKFLLSSIFLASNSPSSPLIRISILQT